MKFEFYISGMTCVACQKKVAEKIKAIDQVKEVEVSLEKGLAQIKSNTRLSAEDISNLLGSKYSVDEAINSSVITKTSKLKQLTPLLLILTYLIAGTLFLSYKINTTPQRGMYIFMGLFFIVFSFFKFLDYQGFPDSFKRYDPLAKRIPGYAKIYPFIETFLGIAYLAELHLLQVLLITLVILSFTTIGVIRVLLEKSEIECACLGTAIKLPMTEATLIENTIMLSMSSILLIDYFF